MSESKTTLNANVETARKTGSDPNVLILAAGDNVGTAIRDLAAGSTVTLRGRAITLQKAVPLGHKIAVRDIASGEKIIKFGAPIGSTVRAVTAGEHVHNHNMKSDYLPSFGRDGSSRLKDGH